MKTTKPEEARGTSLVTIWLRSRAKDLGLELDENSASSVLALLAEIEREPTRELRAQAALIRRSAKYGPSDAWMTHKLERRADELEAGA